MKKVHIIILFLLGFSFTVLAGNHCPMQGPRMSHQEFMKKKEAFLTEKAELTSEEAQAFFPVYKELNRKKRELNSKAWHLTKEANTQELTEKEYEEIASQIYDLRIETAELDKIYFEKFKQILPCKKIFKLQQAELKFHKSLVRDMRNSSKENKTTQKQP